jgi:arsenate reductase (thioredoxin)
VKVLFICTANSCRSQMAESWARHLFPVEWSVSSGGLLTYRITEKTRHTMMEIGLDMDGQETKSIDGFDLNSFDLVVTLSEEAGRFLPHLADPSRHIRRPLKDPMAVKGDPEVVRQAFRTGRDQVRDIVQDIVDGKITAGS